MAHKHQIHVVPQDADLAAYLDEQSLLGWSLVTLTPGMAQRSPLDTQAVPAFVCVLRAEVPETDSKLGAAAMAYNLGQRLEGPLP